MKIIFFGTPLFAVPSLEKLLHHPEFEVLAVVTQPDKRRGRGSKLTPSPVKSLAVEHQIPVWQPKRIKKHPETLSRLKQAQADAFVVVAYGQILSPEILQMPRLGCINGHGSILPEYRGAAPIQWCLYNGEKSTGITTMLMDAGMDTGPMLLKQSTPIGLFDHAINLAERLSSITADLLVETLIKFNRGEIQPTPQDDSQATYASLIKPEDYRLDWSKSALALHNQVRGFFPNCVTSFREQALKISGTIPLGIKLPSELQELEQQWPTLSPLSGKPGEILHIVKRFGPVIQTGDGLLLLQDVKLAGKRTQSGWDFANGTRLASGEILS
ncbi:methionyl-tRNA formyltransferase [Lyngbya sp. PCC 8106]|uniref:methionyl-tRNA formyltransferase n=1 Tax=Lyngbya sp. (strain PCC 8106) TaxID=313612 RepID=UPI0000EAB1E5|nr:methionyl-tRNA formyltransferase [Lyngbya sp. PCC 8106]EAW39308.1 methionyl-tRNA formyltransferase [Lyngbya sp. PCC 8106]